MLNGKERINRSSRQRTPAEYETKSTKKQAKHGSRMIVFNIVAALAPIRKKDPGKTEFILHEFCFSIDINSIIG